MSTVVLAASGQSIMFTTEQATYEAWVALAEWPRSLVSSGHFVVEHSSVSYVVTFFAGGNIIAYPINERA